MNMLDKLFSREINRRTGAHAVSIYIESNTKSRQRTRSLGKNALNSANSNTRIVTKQSQGSLFHRLDIRFPWLKLVVTPFVIVIILLDFLGITISSVNDSSNKISVAPMSKHVQITKRDLSKMLVALTFDDGPSSTTTPTLLDTLSQKDVPATFFMLGSMARNNPDLVRRVKQEGHEVASHTMYHQNLIRIPATNAVSDINEAKDILSGILGYSPTLTRPPYGNINDAIKSAMGTPIILWSVDTLDWKNKNSDAIISTTMSQVHDGAIILMHDVHPTSVETVPALIDTLRDAGYEFVTVSELAKTRQVELSNGTTYYNFRP